MPGLYATLDIGRRALLTHQMGVNVTGHNIANVNTPGYSRQRVNLETSEPVDSKPGQMGTGVRADEIQRIYDRFLAVQINHENQDLGRWEAQKDALEKVENIFNESTGYGLNQAMSEFWNAWHDLANNPSNSAERVVVKAKGDQLAAYFRNMNSDTERIQRDMDESIIGAVEEINSITEQIAHLNQKIAQVEMTGQNANDHRDERDLLLKQLCSLIDVNSFEDDTGKVTVYMRSGRPLVENISSWQLSTETNLRGFQDVVWLDREGNATNVTADISGGKLKGWLETRDVIIPDYLSRLDALAQSIATEVNAIHRTGYGLTVDPATIDPITNPNGDPYTNIDFFTGTSASDIELNIALVNDVNLIAAAQSPDGIPGDNRNAIEISNLQSRLTMNANTATFDNYYNALVSDVGGGVSTATLNLDHQSMIVSQLDNHRESISGVSLDEEMVNLIKFQHAYDASAKLITTVDELLESLINMI